MPAQLLNGKEVADAVTRGLSTAMARLDFAPQLVVVRVGDDPASVAYVRGKDRTAKELGMRSRVYALPATTAQKDLLETVRGLNDDADVDGILVQLPLPPQLDGKSVLEAIDPAKDVDGFHPINVGRHWSGQKTLVPCTPAGLVRIMDHYRLPLSGRHAVIVGRSNLVGKPAAALLLQRDATVSLAHSRTEDLSGLVRQADIVVAALGKHAFITPEMVKPGAVVLDVGITRVAGKLRGDVHPDVAEVAAYLTPVPGGVGPMTVAMLMQNTFDAALARRQGG